jgi:hypothetical protein
MEPWLNQHKTVIQKITGWKIGDKDATDDRLGILTGCLGENDEKSYPWLFLSFLPVKPHPGQDKMPHTIAPVSISQSEVLR